MSRSEEFAAYLSRDELESRIRREVGVKRTRKEARHPRSGWNVDVGRRSSSIPGSSPPEQKVVDYGHFEGRGPAGGFRNFGLPTPVGTRPLKHVYRGVSEEDWKGIQERGHIQSDGRMNLHSDEGTVAATDPRSAAWYLPHGDTGRILKIRVHPEDNWRIAKEDEYAKTPNAIPVDRVVRVSQPFERTRTGSFLRGHGDGHPVSRSEEPR